MVIHINQNTADSMARLNFENFGQKVISSFSKVFFLLLDIRINFGRPRDSVE